MSALDLLQAATDVTYVLVFLLVVRRTARWPFRANADATLLFGDVALIVCLSVVEPAVGIAQVPAVSALTGWLLLALPYLLLRLVSDFMAVPEWIVAGAVGGLVVAAAILLILEPVLPAWAVVLLVAYFAAYAGYASAMFGREAARSRGVARRRMQAVVTGSLLLALVIIVAGLTTLVPEDAAALAGLSTVLGLGSGIAYYLGFAPPLWLRRAWQMSELRNFMRRSFALGRQGTLQTLLRELEKEVAITLDASAASLGLHDAVTHVLRFAPHTLEGGVALKEEDGAAAASAGEDWGEVDPEASPLLARAFLGRRPTWATDLSLEPPGYLVPGEPGRTSSALAVPICAEQQAFGVLVATGPRTSLLVEEDLDLAVLLADQTALLLESRRQGDEAARAEALAAASRAKDEFLATMSHDLRNPLAAIRGTTQVLRRRLGREGSIETARLDTSLAGIEGATGQMASMVDQLLDYARLQMERPLDLERRPMDLVDLARRLVTAQRDVSEHHHIRLDAQVDVLRGRWDASRTQRILQNLVDNARKYSPEGGEIVLRVWREDDQALLSVSDHGIGIPASEIDGIFEPFHRGSNAEGVIPGTGIGLATCKKIAEQQGGELLVVSGMGSGSTFTLKLPLASDAADAMWEQPQADADAAASAVPDTDEQTAS